MFRLCFVWIYIIKGEFVPFVKSAGIGRLCKRTFARLWDSFSHLPEVVYIKGNKTACLGFYCRIIFYDVKPSFCLYVAKGLERLTNFSSRRAYVQKTGLAIGLFCGTNF